MECRAACEVDSNCAAFEIQETGRKICYLYYSTGTPEGDWTQQNGTSNKPVSKSSLDQGFDKGCNIRGRPSTCAGASNEETVVDSAKEAAEQADATLSTKCQQGQVKGDFTTLGCGFCEGPDGS